MCPRGPAGPRGSYRRVGGPAALRPRGRPWVPGRPVTPRSSPPDCGGSIRRPPRPRAPWSCGRTWRFAPVRPAGDVIAPEEEVNGQRQYRPITTLRTTVVDEDG